MVFRCGMIARGCQLPRADAGLLSDRRVCAEAPPGAVAIHRGRSNAQAHAERAGVRNRGWAPLCRRYGQCPCRCRRPRRFRWSCPVRRERRSVRPSVAVTWCPRPAFGLLRGGVGGVSGARTRPRHLTSHLLSALMFLRHRRRWRFWGFLRPAAVSPEPHSDDPWVAECLCCQKLGRLVEEYCFTAGEVGIIKTPVWPPRANAFAERFEGTLRRECPDHLLTYRAGLTPRLSIRQLTNLSAQGAE